MAELNAKEDLFQLWMIYMSKTDTQALQEYIRVFIDSYKDLIDFNLDHLDDGFSEEGPHLTKLPDNILYVLGNQLHQCCFTIDESSVKSAADIIRCLIVLSRNYDNVPLVASCEFVSYAVNISSAVVEKLRTGENSELLELHTVFIKLALHFFECLYDPYFTWRKRLLGWNVDKTRLKFRPALLHVEVVPFFYDCFQKRGLLSDIRLRLLHVFGGIMSGSQHNALKAITPATLDVLLTILSADEKDGPTNEQRQEMSDQKELVLKCIVRLVHVIHCCSPDQRQVEVSQVMEGYMQVLLEREREPDNEAETKMELKMIGAINEMLACQDRCALQVILVSGGTFDSFISLLQKTSLCGTEAQSLAMSILNVMSTVLAGSVHAKDRFNLRVGYSRFVEVLKSLGQPSIELLKTVLNLVVDGIYQEDTLQSVHNTQAAIMLIQWLPDIQSHDLQIWLSKNLRCLCSAEHSNKMRCCYDGMISAILSVLGRERQISATAVSHLIGLLESLGTQSITAIELKQLIGLLRLNEEENQNTYCTRLMRAISTMARREGKEGALRFANIQKPGDGIYMPGIRKWPGTAFSFHTWLCLDCDIDFSLHKLEPNQSHRRQLYSFVSNTGCGFESFISKDDSLVIAVYNKKEYYSVTVPETGLIDSHWHSIGIVHTNSRRPFTTSQLNVYIDGRQKFNAQLKYPNMAEPLTTCCIGSPCTRSQTDTVPDLATSSPTSQEKRISSSTLKSFFRTSKSSPNNQIGVDSIPLGSQDEIWGPPVTLQGQVASVCVFHEAISADQVKKLYLAGPNNLTVFLDESDLSDLPGKLVVHYNAKACKDDHCVDLSANHNDGRLSCQKCDTWDIKDVINCIGGIQVLFPLLEQVNKVPVPRSIVSPDIPTVTTLNAVEERDDFVILPSSSYADTKLEQNQVAGFLTLLRNMIQTRADNQDSFVRTNGAATIGALLQKVNPKLIDVHVLMAVQLLVEATASNNKTLLHHLYQFILFDFRIWSRSDFPVRIGHIQYLSTIIKNDRRHFRKMFGVQYILDVIRSYYSHDCGLSEEDSKTIRVSLLSLIKYYIMKDITAEELAQLLNFTMAAAEENMVCEVLDLLMTLLESGQKQDQLYLLMFEPEVGEMLYGLLTIKGRTIIFYEKIVKVLYLLLKTDKVYEKSKTRMKLLDCGYLGLVGLIQGIEVSEPTIKRFLQQVSITDSTQSFNAVLAILQLVYSSGVDIKLEASRQLLSILVSKNGGAKHFAKQLGWQEAITKLFILNPMAMEPNDLTMEDDDLITMETRSDDTAEEVMPASEGCDIISADDSVDKVVFSAEGGELEEGTASAKPKPPTSLNFKRESSPLDLDTSTPTPIFNKRHIFDLPNDSSEDLSLLSMSRSPSTSTEDLRSPPTDENSDVKPTESSSSLSLSTSASGFESLGGEASFSSRHNSVSQPSMYKALDSLGIHSSFIVDSVDVSEELTQNLLIILLTVMWKGLEGSDDNTWKERCQVFSWIDHISETNDLVRPPHELKRRLLEMMLHSCTSAIRDSGQTSSAQMENAIKLVRMVRCFVLDDNTNNMDKYSERLIEDVMSLLDILAVWDVHKGNGWQEMVQLGLSIILTFAKHPNLELCAVATARLHMLVQTKLISSSAEASFLMGNLNDMVIRAVSESTDNYSFLIPVMKALIDKAYTLLNLDVSLPNLPSTSMSPTFFEDFKTYCLSEEWQTFIKVYVTPQQDHFTENAFLESQTKMTDFWDECQEEMKVNMHKRNRERGDSKLKFQSQVMEVFKRKASLEERRFQNVTVQLRNQHYAAMRQWRAIKRFFTGERGAWAERSTAELHWKLSNQENFSRMKVKLIQNYNFDIHREASLLRDNEGEHSIDPSSQIEHASVAKEALVSKDNIPDDVIGDEEWSVINTASSTPEEYKGKEKLVFSEECELVTLVEVVKGRLEVTTTHVYFFDCSTLKEEGGEDFKWGLPQLREIHFRRYNLRRSALELFLVDQTNYFLNFQKKVRNKVYSRILSLRPPNLIYYGSRSPAELLKASGLTQKWVQREISNFEYLMQLNTIAGRTYNDLSQYPVFPWILRDYTSEDLDLTNPEVFRDLSKPIGVLNPKNEEEIREKFEHFVDPSGNLEPFHFGTHYSNPATVMHYMIRMEPFTTLHIELQGGKFDVADRQFHSVPGTWSTMYNGANDVKELIPEFFYLPTFLKNENEFDLGRLQLTKEEVKDVVLPAWAKSPEDFIFQHRRALESEHVSNYLHNWIDLIFGYKQKGKAAEEALNVFYPYTYEGAVDLDAVEKESERKALEGIINNFGQTPCQLLKESHPQRMTFSEVVARANRTDKHLSVFLFLDQLKVFFVEVSMETDPLVYISVPRSQIRPIIQHGMPDTMVTVSREGILGTHGWLPYDKNISNYFSFEKDQSVSNQKTKKKFSTPFAPGLKVEAKLFVVTHDAKLLFSGGHWDNSVIVYHLGKGKKMNHIVKHIDIVTCLSLDYCGSHLITGSRDTTCMIWQIQYQGGVSYNLSNKPMQTLYGHDNEVTAVYLSTELDMAVSASKDGTVIIHTVRKGHYMRTLRPPCKPSYVLHIPMIAVDEMGHIVLYCVETLPVEPKEEKWLHLYSLNGKHLGTQRLENRLGHMIIKGEYLLMGDNQGELAIYEIFGLRMINTVPLHVPIHSLAVTNGNSHILAGLRDGKLIIIGIKSRSEIR